MSPACRRSSASWLQLFERTGAHWRGRHADFRGRVECRSQREGGGIHRRSHGGPRPRPARERTEAINESEAAMCITDKVKNGKARLAVFVSKAAPELLQEDCRAFGRTQEQHRVDTSGISRPSLKRSRTNRTLTFPDRSS